MKLQISFVILLLASTLCFQAYALNLNSKQSPLMMNQNTLKVLQGFGFTELVEKTLEEDPTQAVANLFAYYIDGRVLDKSVNVLFNRNQEHNLLSYQQLASLLAEEGLQELDTKRMLNLLSLDENSKVDFAQFTTMSNVIFTEALSLITFNYIAEKYGKDSTVSLQAVEDGILTIFKRLLIIYPAPRSEDIEYLAKQADTNKDGRLTLQEFHTFLSLFLKNYRNGILNNIFGKIIFNDNIFKDLWRDEQELKYIEFLKASFFKFLNIALHDDVRSQFGYELFVQFDSDKSGSISNKEFKNLLKDVAKNDAEIATVFALVDTNKSKTLDFSEFLRAIEYYARLLVADFGYQISKETGVASTWKNIFDFLKSGAPSKDAALLTAGIVQAAFVKADCFWWRNGVLSQSEWKTFAAELIRLWKEKIDAEVTPPVTETETEETEEPETETEETEQTEEQTEEPTEEPTEQTEEQTEEPTEQTEEQTEEPTEEETEETEQPITELFLCVTSHG